MQAIHAYHVRADAIVLRLPQHVWLDLSNQTHIPLPPLQGIASLNPEILVHTEVSEWQPPLAMPEDSSNVCGRDLHQ